MTEEFISVREACERFGYSDSHIRRPSPMASSISPSRPTATSEGWNFAGCASSPRMADG